MTEATAWMIAAVCNIPVLMQSAPMSVSTASICRSTNSAGMPWMPSTPLLFCAVTAVMAVAAYPRSAVTVLISA